MIHIRLEICLRKEIYYFKLLKNLFNSQSDYKEHHENLLLRNQIQVRQDFYPGKISVGEALHRCRMVQSSLLSYQFVD